jgi:hypothetical protein
MEGESRSAKGWKTMKDMFKKALVSVACGVTAMAMLVSPSGVSQAKPAKHAGFVSIPAAAFTDDSGSPHCRVAKGPFATYVADPAALTDDCDLVAGIQLPDLVKLRGISCTVVDSVFDNAIEVYLNRVSLVTGELESVFTSSGSVDSGALQYLGDSVPTPGTDFVDNANYAYYVTAAFSYTDFSSAGSNFRVYGCTVQYE